METSGLNSFKCSQVMSPKNLDAMAATVGYLAVRCRLLDLNNRTFLTPEETRQRELLRMWWQSADVDTFESLLDELLEIIDPEIVRQTAKD